MDTSLSSMESPDQVKKWLSVGAGAVGLLLPLAYLLSSLGLPGLLSINLPSVMITVLFLALAMGGAVAGAGYVAKIGAKYLNFPPPVLVTIGFVLGGLIVAAGMIFIVVYVVVNILSALGQAL